MGQRSAGKLLDPVAPGLMDQLTGAVADPVSGPVLTGICLRHEGHGLTYETGWLRRRTGGQ
jgi:hypothetical protein